MPHEPVLIATIAVGLGVAFLLGLVAARLRMPPLVGYLVAGIVVGPFTPGPRVDAGIAGELAEFGIILLMFGVGLHFSVRDLVAVRRIVVPGAILQATLTTAVGTAAGRLWGWSTGASVVLGLSVAVASTVVLLKSLERRDRLDSPDGRLAVGWLVVEDLLMVFALVLLSALAPALRGQAGTEPALGVASTVGTALLKVAGFAALMVVVGRRAVPWLLERVARLGSRELFTLAVLAAALGVGALAANFFGVSFALGAFFAGAIISDSELSARAAAEALPMQDAFAVLFFVSIGMLFDPAVLLARPFEIFGVVALVVVWKTVLSHAVMRLLGASRRSAIVIGASLGQIGEFSFIVAALALSLGLIGQETQTIIVAASLIAITLNVPIVAAAIDLADRVPLVSEHPEAPAIPDAGMMRPGALAVAPGAVTREVLAMAAAQHDASDMRGHVVLIGFGRVGSTVADALAKAGARYVVIEEQERVVGVLRARGARAILGDATRREVLERAGIGNARLLVVTAPEPIRARRIVELAREVNPALNIAVRTDSAAEQEFYEKTLEANGARGRAVYAEREAALNLAHYALLTLGQTDHQADVVVEELRERPTRPTEMFTAIGTHEFRALTRTPPGGK